MDRVIREKTFRHFKVDLEEVEKRHHLVFNIFETGKMTLQEYLQEVVFYIPRSFTKSQFVDFIYKNTIPNQESIDFFLNIKNKYKLQVIAVSNEGKEFTVYRVKKFRLMKLFDAVVSSSFVHLRKPDKDIFQLAIDIAQADVKNSIYVDDRQLLVDAAKKLGVNGICFTTLEDTKQKFAKYGLTLN